MPKQDKKTSAPIKQWAVSKVRRALESIGPPNEWSGGVAMAMPTWQRKQMKDVWNALSPADKATVQAKFDKQWGR